MFALGIMPYITASIIIQVLTPVFPSLQELQKEGELGQRRITQYTRYLTVVLAGVQARATSTCSPTAPARSAAGGTGALINISLRSVILIVVTLTAGATLLMWIGELITQRGIGNGMSLLIFASILTSAPAGISAWWNGSSFEKLSLPVVVLGVIFAVVYVQEGIRRIPIQYAKRMVGPADDLGRLDLPAAARQHGRRDPGHLRRRRSWCSRRRSASCCRRARPRDLAALLQLRQPGRRSSARAC